MLAAPRLVRHRRDMTSLWFLCQGGIADEARRAHAATTGPCARAAPSGRTRSGGTARRDRGLRWRRTGQGHELWRDRRAAGSVRRIDPSLGRHAASTRRHGRRARAGARRCRGGALAHSPVADRLPGRGAVDRGDGRALAQAGVIGSTRTLRVWAYPEPADLRAGYDGLSALVTRTLGQDPLSGHLFLFTNRTRTRAKVLVWDGTGLCVYQKRLEQGRFALLWKAGRGSSVELTLSELTLFLEGSRALERVQLSPAAFVPRPLVPASPPR